MAHHTNKLIRKRNALGTAIFAGMLLLSGCAERKARAFPWATAVLVRPLPPVVRSSNAPTASADADPDFRVEAPAGASRVFSVRAVPPRPHTSLPAAAEPATAGKPTDLVPELSPQEIATAKAQVTASIAVAERNMAIARGRNLSSAQKDVLSKIAGFITEAREAGGEGDWARARNLAKKAEILSEGLVASP